MRRILGPACAAALLATAACGTHVVVTRPAGTSPPLTGSPSAGTGPVSGSPSGPAQAAVGNTLELTGTGSGAVMAVTVTAVADPARGADFLSSPEAGERLVAVQFRLHNTGTATYSDSPSNGAEVIDEQGQGFNATVAQVTAGPAFPAGVHIAPGDTALGYVAFEVPESSRLARVQFTLDSGFANRTGQWAVQGGAAASAAPTESTGPTPSGAATATVTATATATATKSGTVAKDPRQVVEEYYAAVNAHDYARAWALGGRNLAPDYRAFVAGFAGTAVDTLTVTGSHGGTVDIALDALQTDGSHHSFTGTYTVRDGVIVAASVH